MATTDTLSAASNDVLDLIRGSDDDFAASRKGYSLVSWHVRDFVLHVHAIREDGSSEVFEFDLTLRRAECKQF